MIKYLTVAILLISNISLMSQHTNICSSKPQLYFSTVEGDTVSISQSEASDFIKTFMEKINLPMNFEIYECNHKNCENNAYASMDIKGRRAIVFDKDWFATLNTDESKHESLVILAHEIGHHLAAHTLALNYYEYEDAITYCHPESSKYDEKICKANYRNDYVKYLEKSRIQELEADRFAGFICCLYGIGKEEANNTFKKITSNYDDSYSTHPSLDKRLLAIESGYNLAVEYQRQGKNNYNLQEIKGRKIEFKITNLSKIERNALISKVKQSISTKPIRYITQKSEIGFGSGSGGSKGFDKQKMIDFHGDNKSAWKIDKENYYFEAQNQYLLHPHDHDIYYAPKSAIKIEDNILEVLIFDSDSPTIVYTSFFDESSVSLEELEIIFVEIFENGISKVIKDYNKK